jgi:cyclophilin family peptidyl-prolyl cis-trans isomerase
MFSPNRLSVIALSLGLFATMALADEKPMAAKFAEAHAVWEKEVGSFMELRNKIYTATSATERNEIIKQLDAAYQKLETLRPSLEAAAKAAYAEAPNADPDVTAVLTQEIAILMSEDKYESALKQAATLIENKCDDAQVFELAGTAAFNIDSFDAASQYFAKAKAAGNLSQQAQMLARESENYKKYWADEVAKRKQEAEADDLPRVLLKTSKGDVTIELFENEAPQAVGNFVSLVEKGFYDGLTFHRVLPGFMAQGGCPDGTGGGGPGYDIYCECYKPDYRKHFRGTLSMAHAGKNTGGSQFFLTFVPTPHLNGRHTAFGRVIEGFDVLEKLQRINPQRPQPGVKPDTIVKAEVIRKRDHKYEPTPVKKDEG